MYSFSGNFHIHVYVSVSDLYIPRIGPHIFWNRIGRLIVGTVGRAIPFLGIFVSNFRYWFFAVRDILYISCRRDIFKPFITGPHVIVKRETGYQVQPAETHISRGQNITQTPFYYRTTCHRHTEWSAARQLHSRDIYQPRTKHISNYILLQDPMSSSHAVKCILTAVHCTAETYISRGQNIFPTTFYFWTPCHRHTGMPAVQQRRISSADKTCLKSNFSLYRTTCHRHTGEVQPTAVQQRRISAADKTYFKTYFITGPHVIVTRGEVQPDSCTLYSRDIYQPRT